MRKFIVSTTISAPNAALHKYAAMDGWELIVVGDLKTPHDAYAGWNYLSPDDQVRIDGELSDLIGWNCVMRRNMGFLHALRNGADIVATVDDDNDPLPGWGQCCVGQTVGVEYHQTELPAFDPLWATDHQEIWHRGFPVQWVSQRRSRVTAAAMVPDVQACLWNGDPDIDGICRLLHPGKVDLQCRRFAANKPSPFNSQNTMLSAAALRHFFCFPHIGRLDDIFASYVVQKQGFKVVYDPPTVRQDRNRHGADAAADMLNETEGYRNAAKFVEIDQWETLLPDRTVTAWNRWRKLVA